MSASTKVPYEIIQKIRGEMLAGYAQLLEFSSSTEFKSLLKELYALPAEQRPQFVLDVILQEDERNKRGVHVPVGILVLRSAFGDRRPTLFCLKKYLSPELHRFWQNVNITFDNPSEVSAMPEQSAWRKPLPVSVQAALIATANDLT